MKRALTFVVVAGLASTLGLAEARAAAEKHGHLGIAVAQVPPAMANQLSGVLNKGEGVLVAQVAKNSPAEKAGLKTDDILLSFGDHKLHSPEELVKAVRAEKAGHEVPVSYLRGGKKMLAKVTLEEREATPATSEKTPSIRFAPDEQARKFFQDSHFPNDEAAWTSFDAIRL